MDKASKKEYFEAIYERYQQANVAEKRKILDEYCKVCGYNRKYAIRKLNRSGDCREHPRRTRAVHYTERVIDVLWRLWEASGYLCSVRLKAVVRLWLPWIRAKWQLTKKEEHQLLAISPRQLDRRFRHRKSQKRKKMMAVLNPEHF